jgi:hypothetical protein
MPTLTAPSTQRSAKLSAADAVWIATVLLQREDPSAVLSVAQIVSRTIAENLTDAAQNTIAQHVSQHCVASLPPQPNRLRMLTAHGRGERTLFREGDPVNPGRINGRTRPEAEDVPERFHDLIHWYDTQWYPRYPVDQDPLLAAAGTGREIWKVDAVLYIQKLREDPPGETL